MARCIQLLYLADPKGMLNELQNLVRELPGEKGSVTIVGLPPEYGHDHPLITCRRYKSFRFYLGHRVNPSFISKADAVVFIQNIKTPKPNTHMGRHLTSVKVDWDNAPDGATAFSTHPKDKGELGAWIKFDGEEYYRFCNNRFGHTCWSKVKAFDDYTISAWHVLRDKNQPNQKELLCTNR